MDWYKQLWTSINNCGQKAASVCVGACGSVRDESACKHALSGPGPINMAEKSRSLFPFALSAESWIVRFLFVGCSPHATHY